MTHEEELDFLRACGAKLSELTQDMLLGTALVMLFPHGTHGARIHAISNLTNDKCQELLEEYVAKARGLNKPPRRESVWLLMACRDIDGVSVERVESAHATKQAAEKARDEKLGAKGIDLHSWTVEEQEVL